MAVTLDPKIWGPPAWIFLHSTTFGYSKTPTDEEKNDMKNLLISLKSTLPCNGCKKNYKSHLETLTDDIISSKEKLVKWLIDVHNMINKHHGKRELSHEEAIQFYYDLYSKKAKFICQYTDENNIPKCKDTKSIYIIILLIVLILLIWYWIRNKQ